MMCTYTCT